jgi:hypothetical protein
MDPIQNLISATDPADNDPSVPDGEVALSRMLSHPAVFSDLLPPDVTSLADYRKRRQARLAGLLALAAACVSVGVLVAANLGSLTAFQSPAAGVLGVTSPTASASTAAATPAPVTPATASAPAAPATAAAATAAAATPPASAAAVPIASARFVSDSAGASFDLPSGWTAVESTDRPEGYPGTEISVRDEAGKKVADFYHGTVGGVGGACGPGPYKMYELDSAPVLANRPWALAAGVRFSYRVLDVRSAGGAFDFQLGLVDATTGQLQDSCLMYSFVAGAPQGTLSFADRTFQNGTGGDPAFASLEEAKAYMMTPEYRKLKAMITSLRVS